MGASLFLTIFFAFSPFVIRCGNDPNIDWLIAIGYLLPPQIGLFFVLAKPQIGLAVALYWLVQTWKIGRLKLVLKTFLPVIICFLISFIFYGLWPLNSISLGNVAHNSSLWPYSIPIGFFLFFYGLYKKNLGYSIISTPLISPYVGPVSWAAPLLGALPNNWLFMLFIIVTWIIQFISHRPM